MSRGGTNLVDNASPRELVDVVRIPATWGVIANWGRRGECTNSGV